MIKIYYAEISLIENPQIFELWLEKMHLQRREKVLRCKHKTDGQRSLLAGILLRKAVEQAGLYYEEQVFGVIENGKPVLLSQKDFHFSISHAGEYVLCAVSNNVLGADCEDGKKAIFREENRKRLESAAKRSLSEQEYRNFLQQDVQGKQELFLKYWTRKESYSKALGRGLAMDFSRIETEELDTGFWSGWMEEGIYCSIFSENLENQKVIFEKVFHLNF